jgi:hypothetical protein
MYKKHNAPQLTPLQHEQIAASLYHLKEVAKFHPTAAITQAIALLECIPPRLDGWRGIQNQESFADVDWLPLDEWRVIGKVCGVPLYCIGTEQGSGAAIVAQFPDHSAQVFALPLWELLKARQPGEVVLF